MQFFIALTIIVPNYFGLKEPILILIVALFAYRTYKSVLKTINGLKSKDASTSIIKMNKATSTLAAMAAGIILIRSIYSLIFSKPKAKNTQHLGPITGYIATCVAMFVVFLGMYLVLSLFIEYCVKNIVYRYYFVRFGEAFREKLGLTKKQWYGERSYK